MLINLPIIGYAKDKDQIPFYAYLKIYDYLVQKFNFLGGIKRSQRNLYIKWTIHQQKCLVCQSSVCLFRVKLILIFKVYIFNYMLKVLLNSDPYRECH